MRDQGGEGLELGYLEVVKNPCRVLNGYTCRMEVQSIPWASLNFQNSVIMQGGMSDEKGVVLKLKPRLPNRLRCPET